MPGNPGNPHSPIQQGKTPSGIPSKKLIAGLDKEQQQNANLITIIGQQMKLSDRDIAIAIMTAMDESSLHNLKGGDRDSAGLFQQRPSMGWGTYQEVTNPTYATRTFYKHLEKVRDRNSILPWLAAQRVQNSGTPDGSNYERYWDSNSNGFQTSAQSIASYYLGGGIFNGGPVSTAPDIPVDSSGVNGILNSLGNSVEGPVSSAMNLIDSWEKAVEAIGAFFAAILWIFNVDHFMKFLLYCFGVIAIGVGLGLVSFGAGKGENEAAG